MGESLRLEESIRDRTSLLAKDVLSFEERERVSSTVTQRVGENPLEIRERCAPLITYMIKEPSLNVGERLGAGGRIKGGDVLLLSEREKMSTHVGVKVGDVVKVGEGYIIKREERF